MAELPDRAEVVVVGAGLSGLVAARRLVAAGVDVVVVEAQDAAGGRVARFTSASGRVFERGGEYLGLGMPSLRALADELGVGLVELPGEGAFVRWADGRRVVEAFPLERDPEAAEAYGAATALLDELAAEVPVDAPWLAPRAAEWDARTLEGWLREHVPNSTARDMLSLEFDYCGGAAGELSLLFVLWTVRAMGGMEAWSQGTTHRFDGGSSELVARMAAALGERIVTGTPVRAVEHDADGVTVRTDRGVLRADAVVAALAPALCGRIIWEPALPLMRDRLQDRYLEGHGIKAFAVYDTPWWRDRGLAGVALGRPPMKVILDVSPQDGNAGVLVGMVAVTGATAAAWSAELSDEDRAKALFVEHAGELLGGDAPEPSEVHLFSWVGAPWSVGCAVGLPPGVLSTAGPSLRAPIGRIVWAGAETGAPQNDWMEAAVSAGERAATEAAALAGAAVPAG